MENIFNEESPDLFLLQEVNEELPANSFTCYLDYGKFVLKKNSSLQKNRSYIWPEIDEQKHVIDKANFMWCSEYSIEIMETLKETEKKRNKIHYKSPQKEFRASLVQVIRYSAEILALGRTTVHLAVYLLDVFMDSYAIIQSKLNLVALTCLLLASKIEEKDLNVPKLERLSKISRLNAINEFQKAEVRLLKFFEWYLLFPTGATYLEYYVSNILSRKDILKLLEDDKCSNFTNENEILNEARSLAFAILDLTLQDQSLVQAVPSVTAAACLAVVRSFLGLYKWNDDMFVMTGYKFSEIEKMYETLMQIKKRKDVEEHVKRTSDSGFLISSESEVEDEHFGAFCTFKRRRID